MKVVAVIDNAIGVGGGFDQALNAVIQMQRLCDGRFEFEAITSRAGNVEVLAKLGVSAALFQYTWLDRGLARFATSSLWHFAQQRLRLIGSLEKKLIARGADLVYFVAPASSPIGLQRLNYIATAWDLAHRDTPEFPEVRDYGAFFMRENTYQNLFASAYLVLTDSARLADLASFRYGVDRDRFIPMPFGASPLLEQHGALTADEVAQYYRLPREYFYYPAQFWSHKNHIRILEALCLLREQHGYQPVVVFSGKDHGNLAWVRQSIQERDLESSVLVLGFVPSNHVRGLYEGATAVIMPTYFGPTNLPPLEAWSIGVPLIYSAHLLEQVKDAAEFVNPDDAQSVANAMLEVAAPSRREALITAGKRRLAEIACERKTAEEELLLRLDRYAQRRKLWN